MSFVTSTATVFNTTTSPKTASVAALAGDILVAYGIAADATSPISTPTNDGAALTWTAARTDATSSHTWVGMWTTTVDTSRTIVVTFATSGAFAFGGCVSVFRTVTVGASSVTLGSGAPSGSLLTTKDHSAAVVCIGDWAAVVGSPTWLVNAGAFVSTSELVGDGSTYSARGGYHADAGLIATLVYGVSSPTGETYSIIVLELKSAAGGGGGTPFSQPSYTSSPVVIHKKASLVRLGD
jgi:hypothetical protein